MKPFEIQIDTLIIRFYLMMAVIIGSFFAGVPYLALLALPIFLSAMMGVKFFPKKKEKKAVQPTFRKIDITRTKMA